MQKSGGGSLIALFSFVNVPEAKAALIVDVTGTPGTGFTTWTFSGSDTASANGPFRVFPNDAVNSSLDTTTITTSFTNNGNFIADASIENTSFSVLTGSATITAAGNSESLGGIFLDNNGPFDALGFRTATSPLDYLPGDTISFSGTITLGVDLNQLNLENYLSSPTVGQFKSGPLELNVSESAATTPEPSTLLGLLTLGGLGLISRKKG